MLSSENEKKEYEKYLMHTTSKKMGRFTLKGSIEYWKMVLLQRTMELIDVESDNINTNELKKQLLINGMSCIRRSDVFNNIGAYYCSKSNVTGQYFDVPISVTYYSPQESGEAIIGQDCVLFRNSPLYTPVFPLIERYASLLAHADITIQFALVKYRIQGNVFVSKDDDVKKQISGFFNNAYNGALTSIVDENAMGIENLQATSGEYLKVTELLEARDNLLTMYFNDIGVQSAKNKKGNILVPEIESAKPRLLLSLNDMLKTWREDAKKCENIFNIKIKVELSDEVKQQFDTPVSASKQEGGAKNSESDNK